MPSSHDIINIIVTNLANPRNMGGARAGRMEPGHEEFISCRLTGVQAVQGGGVVIGRDVVVLVGHGY